MFPTDKISYTGIGRQNETEFEICTTLKNKLGHVKSSFYCVHKLLTIVNRLHGGN